MLSRSLCTIPKKVLFTQPKFKLISVKSNYIDKLGLIKPECQRAIDMEQVNSIITFQLQHLKDYDCFFYNNPITIAEYNKNKYIIDGQHRLQSIMLLNQKYKPFDVLFNVLSINSKKEIDEKYIAINQNKPVPLPNNINDWKLFTRYVDEYFQQNYSIYFSKSEQPRLPNFNKEKLLNYLNDNNIPEKINYDYSLFINEVENLNNFYQQTYTTSLTNLKFNVITALDKVKKKQPNKPFVLSLFRKFEWVDRIIFKLNSETNYMDMNHITTDYRIKIKPKLRREVWFKCYSTQIEGECYVCSENINYDNFHCGHIESVFYNGKTELSNLLPICSSCNIDMGIKNLHTYKKELEQELK